MNEAKKILLKLLNETSLAAYASTHERRNQVAALVVHPSTGKHAEFVVSIGTRELRSLSNLRARMRRFSRNGCDLHAGHCI